MAIVGQNTILNQYVPTFCINRPVDGQLLVYDSNTRAWMNKNIFGEAYEINEIKYYQDVGDGITTDYTLPWAASGENSLIISIQGVKQSQDSYDVTIDETNNETLVSFVEAPASGDLIEFIGIIVNDEDMLKYIDFTSSQGLYRFRIPWVANRSTAIYIYVNGIKLFTNDYGVEPIGSETVVTLDQPLSGGEYVEVYGVSNNSENGSCFGLIDVEGENYTDAGQYVYDSTLKTDDRRVLYFKTLRENNAINLTTDGNSIFIGVNEAELNIGGNYVKVPGINNEYYAETDDSIIGVSSLNFPKTIYLPDVKETDDGHILIIKDEAGFAGSNNITITVSVAGQKIDSADTIVINTDYGSVTLYSEGTSGSGDGKWFRSSHGTTVIQSGSDITNLSDLEDTSITNAQDGEVLVWDGVNDEWINSESIVTSVFGRTGDVVALDDDYSLGQMSDVDLTTDAPDIDDVLSWDGNNWIPVDISTSGGAVTSVFGRTGDVVGEEGDYDIDQLGDVDTSTVSPVTNNVLTWDGVNWVPEVSLIESVFGRTGVITAQEGDYDIDQLGDVDTTTSAPNIDDVLSWDGSNWVPVDISTSGGAVTSVFGRTGAVTAQENDYRITQLGDVDTTTITPNVDDVLAWDGNNWIPQVNATIDVIDAPADGDVYGRQNGNWVSSYIDPDNSSAINDLDIDLTGTGQTYYKKYFRSSVGANSAPTNDVEYHGFTSSNGTYYTQFAWSNDSSDLNIYYRKRDNVGNWTNWEEFITTAAQRNTSTFRVNYNSSGNIQSVTEETEDITSVTIEPNNTLTLEFGGVRSRPPNSILAYGYQDFGSDGFGYEPHYISGTPNRVLVSGDGTDPIDVLTDLVTVEIKVQVGASETFADDTLDDAHAYVFMEF